MFFFYIIGMEVFAFSLRANLGRGCFHFLNTSITIRMDVEAFAVSECFCFSKTWRCLQFLNAFAFSRRGGVCGF